MYLHLLLLMCSHCGVEATELSTYAERDRQREKERDSHTLLGANKEVGWAGGNVKADRHAPQHR